MPDDDDHKWLQKQEEQVSTFKKLIETAQKQINDAKSIQDENVKKAVTDAEQIINPRLELTTGMLKRMPIAELESATTKITQALDAIVTAKQQAPNVADTTTARTEEENKTAEQNKQKNAESLPVAATITRDQPKLQNAQTDDNKKEKKEKEVRDSKINNLQLKQSDKKSTKELFNSMFTDKNGQYKQGFGASYDEETKKTTYTFEDEDARRKFAVEYANQHPGEKFKMKDGSGKVVFQSDGFFLHERNEKTFGKDTWSVTPTTAIADGRQFVKQMTDHKDGSKTLYLDLTKSALLKNESYRDSLEKLFKEYATKNPTVPFEVKNGKDRLFQSDGKGSFKSIQKDGSYKEDKIPMPTPTPGKTTAVVSASNMNEQKPASAKPSDSKKVDADTKTTYGDIVAAHNNKLGTSQVSQTQELNQSKDQSKTLTSTP